MTLRAEYYDGRNWRNALGCICQREELIDLAVRRQMWPAERETFRVMADLPPHWRPATGTLAWYWIAWVRREFQNIVAGDP